MCSRTGGVDEYDVGALGDAFLHRVEGDRSRVAALGAAHRAGSDALAPGLELVGRGGAEGVRGAQHDAAAVGDEHPGELARRGRLAGAVDPDDHHDAGRRVAALRLDLAVEFGAQQSDELLAQQGAQLVGRTGTEDADALTEPLHQFLGGRDTDVGGEEGVLDLLPGVLVEVVAGQEGEQALAQGVLRTREPGAEPHQTARGGLGDLEFGCLRLDDDRGVLDGSTGAGETDLLDGAPRFVARRLGFLADTGLGGRSDGRRARRRRGRQLLLLAAADHEPADQADRDQGDDYSKDDDFHNASSIGHGRGPARSRKGTGVRRMAGLPRLGVKVRCCPWRTAAWTPSPITSAPAGSAPSSPPG